MFRFQASVTETVPPPWVCACGLIYIITLSLSSPSPLWCKGHQSTNQSIEGKRTHGLLLLVLCLAREASDDDEEEEELLTAIVVAVFILFVPVFVFGRCAVYSNEFAPLFALRGLLVC